MCTQRKEYCGDDSDNDSSDDGVDGREHEAILLQNQEKKKTIMMICSMSKTVGTVNARQWCGHDR